MTTSTAERSLEISIHVDTSSIRASMSKVQRETVDGMKSVANALTQVQVPESAIQSVKQTGDEYRKASEKIKDAATEASNFSKAMDLSADMARKGMESLRGKVEEVKDTLKSLAVKGALFGLATKEAIEFEAAMTSVRKVMDFETPKAFTEVRDAILDMTRSIPMAANELAAIATAGGQMGVAANEVRPFTELVAQMATAFNLTADAAGRSVGELKNVFNLTIPGTRELSDAINYLGNKTQATEKDLIEVLTRVGAMSTVFGLAKEETAALAATFLSLGLGPERASTAINALLRELLNAESGSKKAQEAFLSLGTSASAVAQQIQAGPKQAMIDLLNTFSNLSKTEKISKLNEIFGKEFSDEILLLVGSLKQLQSNLDLVSDKSGYAGSTQKEFKERMGDTAAQMTLAKNAIAEISIAIGNVFLPAAQVGASVTASLAQGLASIITAYPITSIAAMTAGTALLSAAFKAWLASLLASMVPFLSFSGAWTALSLLLGGMAGVMINIGTAILGLVAPLTSVSGAVAALTAGVKALLLSPVGIFLTSIGVAIYAYQKATESAVQPALELAKTLGTTRMAGQEKIKTLEELQAVLRNTAVGTKEHTDAEMKLAEILPGANLSMDERGRVLARVGSASKDNTAALQNYIAVLKTADHQNLALQLEAQATAFIAAKGEVDAYRDVLENKYGFSANVAATQTQILRRHSAHHQ
ncbi:MAG: phage tail tape measure protein [Magnetococcus sp. YQC-5]